MQRSNDDLHFSVGYIEIYNEMVYDLLNRRQTVHIARQQKGSAVQLSNKEVVAKDEVTILSLLHKGNASKMPRSGAPSEEFNRSHTIFQLVNENVRSTVVCVDNFIVILLGYRVTGSTKPKPGRSTQLFELGRFRSVWGKSSEERTREMCGHQFRMSTSGNYCPCQRRNVSQFLKVEIDSDTQSFVGWKHQHCHYLQRQSDSDKSDHLHLGVRQFFFWLNSFIARPHSFTVTASLRKPKR